MAWWQFHSRVVTRLIPAGDRADVELIDDDKWQKTQMERPFSWNYTCKRGVGHGKGALDGVMGLA
jgi:hypothetical protein